MALEDLTGATKYLDDLVETNPVSTPTADERKFGAGHIRGIKNVIKNTFPNITGAVLLTPAEFNLLVGKTSVPGGFPSGTIMAFYQAAAPTNWTQDTTTSNLDGSTMRVVTGTAGGAVGGTHNLESAPDPNHGHSDTLYVAGVALSEAHMPAHTHQWVYPTDTSSTSPDVTSTDVGIHMSNNNTSATSRKYDLNGPSVDTTINVSPTDNEGGGLTHTHVMPGSVTATTTLTAFAPKYVNVVICEKD